MSMKVTVMVDIKKPREYLAIGEKIVFIPDPSNSYDKDAIRFTRESSAEFMGFVANSPHLVLEHTKSASEANRYIQSGMIGTVKYVARQRARNGNMVNCYVVDLEEGKREQQGKGETKMASTKQLLKIRILGSKSQYPIRFEKLVPDFEAGNVPYVKLEIQGDNIVAIYNNQECGYISKEKGKGISDFEDVLASVGDETIAKITNRVGAKLIAEFSVDAVEIEKQKVKRSNESVKDEIVSKGIMSAEELEDRISVLQDYGVTSKQMAGVFATYRVYDSEVKKLIPDKPKTLYKDESGIMKRSIAYVNMGRNLMLEGDRGVGKNVMIETMAWLFARPLYEFSLNSQHDNTSLLGGKTIEVDDDGNNVMGFDPEVIVQAGEAGGILVLDEFNTSVGHVMSILNSYLDDRRRLSVPGYRVIQAHENFVAIGTMNKDYQSTFELNEATSDRFVPIIFPKNKSIIETLKAKCPTIDIQVVQKCNRVYQGILKCVTDGEISEKAITIRGFIDACMGTEMDIPLKQALIDNVANRCSDLDERKSIENMIEDYVG